MDWLTIPVPEIFGNYMLKEMVPINIPAPLSLFPATPLAKAIMVFLFIILLGIIYTCWVKWKKNAYRREALKTLTDNDPANTVLLVPNILKNTAINAYSDTNIPSLTGHDWVAFLNSKVKNEHLFSPMLEIQLLKISYNPPSDWEHNNPLNTELVEAAIKWIKKHPEERQ